MVDLRLDITSDTSKVDIDGVADDLDNAKRAADDLDASLADIGDVDVDIKAEVNRQALATAERELDRAREDMAEAIELGLDTKEFRRDVRNAEADVKAMRKVVDAEAAKMEDDLDIDANIDVDTDVDQGLRRASGATAEFKDEARQNFGEVTSSFSGEMDSIADLAQGTLGGLAGSLAGPIGLAVGAAAAGVGLLYSGWEKAKEEADEAAEAASDLADSVRDAEDPAAEMRNHFADWAAEMAETQKSFLALDFGDNITNMEALADASEAAGLNASDFVAAMADPDLARGAEGVNDYVAALEDSRTSIDQEIAALIERENVMGASSDTIEAERRALNARKEAIDALLPDLQEEAESLELGAQLAEVKAEADDQLAAATGEATTEQKELNDELDTAKEVLDEANEALSDYLGTLGNTRAAYDDFLDAVDGLSEAVEENGTKFKGNSVEARDNRDALQEVTDANADVITGMLEQGASVDEVSTKHKNMHGDLVTTLEDMGLNKKEAKELATQYLGVPGEVETYAELVDNASKKAEDVEEEVRDLDGDKATVYVDANDTDAEWTVGRYQRLAATGINIPVTVSGYDSRWTTGSNGSGGARTLARADRSGSTAVAPVNLVRVNIAGREVRSEVDSMLDLADRDRSLHDLMFTGGRP